MRVLVISNDVIPGFGVPVAAPGLRAAGLAEGLTAHGYDVTVAVPKDLLTNLFGTTIPLPPDGSVVIHPSELMATIDKHAFNVVVFINANLTPHLQPRPGVHFVYDMFAPKMLESLASPASTRPWQDQAAEKARAIALADSVWVNGQRKMGYALSWMMRTDVDDIRRNDLGLPSIVDGRLIDRIALVEMPVPLPNGVAPVESPREPTGPNRLGIAGYAQAWSALPTVHHGHQLLVDHGHELHALLPEHWGGSPSTAVETSLPSEVHRHSGPLGYSDFAEWVQSMDAMVDVFAPSAERRFAMITRSAVALRLGVPLIHAVDSEISDIVTMHDAGWVLDPDDVEAWHNVAAEISDPKTLARKSAGARAVSTLRLEPAAALADAAKRLAGLGH